MGRSESRIAHIMNSDSKSHVVDGQLSYSIMSDADIESGFEELKAKGVISDD